MDRSHALELPPKILFNHGRPHYHGYPRNFKRQKFEATSRFTRRWRPSFSPPVRKAVVALNPLGTKDSLWRRNKSVATSRSKHDSRKPVVSNVRRRLSGELRKGRWHKIGTLSRQSLGQGSREILHEPASSSKKYPPPTIQKYVYSGDECGMFIAKDTQRPSEHEVKVIGEAMETDLENCSTELSGDEECVLTSELRGKTNSDHGMSTEATWGHIESHSKFAGAVVSDPSLVMKDRIKFLELNHLENKSPSPTTKPVELSESSLFGPGKIEVLEPNSFSKKATEACEAPSLTTKAMDAVYRESGNYLLVKESNHRSTVGPYLVDLNRIKVCKALNLFDDIYQNLLQQLEEKPKEERKKAGQIPIEAALTAKQELNWFNTNERILGAVPGIEVGDQFRFRAQLVLIGLHCQYISGIDYMKKDGQILATSIVDSGYHTHEKASNLYTSASESPDVFTYTGQGGNPRVDHRLEGGNLALKNSMEMRAPVRVFRRLQTNQATRPSANSGKITSLLYDGLYVVSNCTQERGPHGKLIFKFQFTRVTGQPELAKSLVSKANKLQVHGDCNVVEDDISQGKEKLPIRALNSIDDEKPPRFKYVTEMVCPEDVDKFASSCGCDCINGCSDLEPCSCLIKNGGEIPFNENGSILRAKSIIYECGPSCKCPPSCKNRVSQHGVRYPLEIFKTKSKGWGVRSQDFISQGSFICEYAGELLSETEAEKRKGKDEYLFDIGNNYDNHAAPKTTTHHQQARNSKKRNDNCDFTVDAAEYGNVGRFLNHSCSPNVFAQDVLYDHDDKRRSHIMLFASKSLPPLRELTFDYNYKIDQVCDVNGNIKKKNCYCGARSCSGRMY